MSAWACVTCAKAHEACYAMGDIARLTTDVYLSAEPAMKPSDAYACIVARLSAGNRPTGRPQNCLTHPVSCC